MTEDKATSVRVPHLLKEEFETLPTQKKWLNFADFCREAVREKLTQEQRKASWVDEAPSEDDPPPQE